VKRGRNYVGLCPFHKEKTPSFVVSPEKQIFSCFGCNTGGNVFSLIGKIENVDFLQSVKIAGDIVGIPVRLDDRDDRQNNEISGMLKVNSGAAALYHKHLFAPDGAPALEYLKARGVSVESIREFQLGFAPGSWNFLLNRLRPDKAMFEKAVQLGLLAKSQKDDGSYYDQFRRRIIFPIKDAMGKVLAFGGRVIGDGQPKYLNSQESAVFQKRNILYGFDKAKNDISDNKRAIIVEGYLDVIGCYQSGIKNVAAPLGTALTKAQVGFLSRYCNEIVLLFDADSAGVNAAHRSLDLADDINVDIKVAVLPESDPFEFVVKNGSRPLMALVDSAKSPVDFRLMRIMEERRKNGDTRTLMACLDLLKGIKLESNRSVYIRKISSLLAIDENSIRKDFAAYAGKQNLPSVIEKANKTEGSDFVTKCHRSLIALICNHPDLIKDTVIDFSIKDIKDSASKNILSKMSELYSADGILNINKLFDFFSSDLELTVLNQSFNESSDLDDPIAAYMEIYLSMKLHEIDARIAEYAAFTKTKESPEYLTEIDILRREKERLSHYIYNRRKD
jgi:DNA primase